MIGAGPIEAVGGHRNQRPETVKFFVELLDLLLVSGPVPGQCEARGLFPQVVVPEAFTRLVAPGLVLGLLVLDIEQHGLRLRRGERPGELLGTFIRQVQGPESVDEGGGVKTGDWLGKSRALGGSTEEAQFRALEPPSNGHRKTNDDVREPALD